MVVPAAAGVYYSSMTNTTEDTEPAFPEGHFTSVGIPTPFGYVTRCKCGYSVESDTLTGAWALSSAHRTEAWRLHNEKLANQLQVAAKVSYLF